MKNHVTVPLDLDINYLEVKPIVDRSINTICLGHDVQLDNSIRWEFGAIAQQSVEPNTSSYPVASVNNFKPLWKPAELLTTIRDMEMQGGCICALINVLHALVVADEEHLWSFFTPLVALGVTAEDSLGMRVFPTLIRKENKIFIRGIHDVTIPNFKNFLLRPKHQPAIRMIRVAA